MMKPIKIYFVLGEESGDALGTDLLPALVAQSIKTGAQLEVIGLAGPKLETLGVKSLFTIEEIAVMGFSAVIARLPNIIRRVKQTVADILQNNPDLVVLIDSPEFTHAVGKRVRAKNKTIKIVNYVCPSVWAWRAGRAKKMTTYVDHVLTLLPFEPQVLAELQGPPATYVGHPLVAQVADTKSPGDRRDSNQNAPILLVLPGSRSSEIKRLLDPFGETLTILRQRGVKFDAVLPAVPHLKQTISDTVKDWPVSVQVVDSKDNDLHFASAYAALAASGTVSLQLALHKIPMTLAYILDPIARRFTFLVSSWTVVLPNLISGWPLVPEDMNHAVKPQRMARQLERLLVDTPERAAQLSGFAVIVSKMATKKAPADTAAEAIFKLLKI